MHPNRAFDWQDADEMRAFVQEQAFAHLFVATPEGPMVAHLPITPHGDHWRFHLARHNRIATHLDGAKILASVSGPQGYISPDWYAESGDQVPTWNYIAVEIEGTAHALAEADLAEQIDTLSHVHEARLAPKPEWTRDKVSEAKLRGMLSVIQAFEIRVTAMRGTRKLSQNKRDTDRAGVIAALGDTPLARAMRR